MTEATLELTDDGSLYPVADANTLVVLLHGYNRKPRHMQRLADKAREAYPRCDILAPKLPLHLPSLADPRDIAAEVVARIDQLKPAYESIILVGHSTGAVLARKIWVLAHGVTEECTIDASAARSWAGKIDRIIQMAAISRGWMISSALSPLYRLGWTIGSGWGNFCRHVLRRDPVIFGLRRGAPFLTQTRLQCLALDHAIGQRPLVVQLLGTADDIVAPTDNVDLATGGDFLYLEVPNATHLGIVNLEGESDDIFQLALTGSRAEIELKALSANDVFDLNDTDVDDHDAQTAPTTSSAVDEVVFVIHGIRDRGFWTRRIAREIKTFARSHGRVCRTVTSTYGYFAMGPFLVPWVRRSKVEWLLDQYVTAKALYPNANFSYVGHSNGTYLLAKALELCPAVKFRHVLFAGSVVRTDFDWGKFIPARVAKVVNYVATRDLVVAIFPNGLQALLQDVGGAGHRGFGIPGGNGVTNFFYVNGDHGAALGYRRWKEMAAFVIDGALPLPPEPLPVQPKWMKLIGYAAPVLCIALAGIIAVGFLYVLAQFSPDALFWLLVLLLAGAGTALVLTRA